MTKGMNESNRKALLMVSALWVATHSVATDYKLTMKEAENSQSVANFWSGDPDRLAEKPLDTAVFPMKFTLLDSAMLALHCGPGDVLKAKD
jgi:hypothetical protein